MRLIKEIEEGKVGTAIPIHKDLLQGTVSGILRLTKITLEEFYEKQEKKK